MATVRSFDPVAAPDAAILFLGSMPGRVSLARQEYYANPQNLFWRFMGELFDAGPEKSYEMRLEILQGHRVALWDVLKQCDRSSSMDSEIAPETIKVNDFGAFFAMHACISHVFFNGSMAEKVFRRHVLREMDKSHKIGLTLLPSTSPANAAISFPEKLLRWQSVRTASF